MDILGQSALILAVTAFAIALTALSRNLWNRLVVTYACLCGLVAGWALSFSLSKFFGVPALYKVHLAFNLVLAPAGIFFVRELTRVDTAFTRWLFRVSVAYAVAVIGLEWSVLGDQPAVLALAFFGPSFLVLVCVYLMYVDWRIKRGAGGYTRSSTVGLLSRRNWIYAGALVLLGSAAMDHIPFLGDVVPGIGNILLCLYLFIISEAIIHQRLLNVSALYDRVLVLVFISACFTSIYCILVGWIENAPALFLLNTFLASFIILIVVEPIKKLTHLGVRRVFSRKYMKLERRVEEAQQQLTGALDTVGVAQRSLAFLEGTIRCESATVFVLRSDGTKFRRIRGFKDDALLNREILANHPLAEFFGRMRRRGETPVILDSFIENEIDRSTSQTLRQTYDLVLKGMQALNSNIVVPFIDGETVLGFAAVRASSPPESWGNNWGVLSVIYPFFLQAARVLRNMEVYVRLRERDRLAALGEMAAGLAHEIRNPLGAIKGAAQYLQPQSEGPQSAFLQVIVEEVNRLNKVVTQFLDYSRPLAADLVEYDAGSILERTHALFRSARAASMMERIQIELLPPPGGFATLPRISCAPEQIKQVLVNLVQNSVQVLGSAAPDGGGKIVLGAAGERRARDGSTEVVLYVEDNGPGIPRENIDKIFIPFFTTCPGGTGLGLPICSRIVEAHGGTIDVATEEGKFTRFSLRFPVSGSSQ